MTAGSYMQICLTATKGCDGPGLARILRRVLEVFPAVFVAISDMDLVGKSRTVLVVGANNVRVLLIADLLAALDAANQVVWGNIFLCSSRVQAEAIRGDEDYVASLRKANALVRVVDATYYYVYGLSSPAMRALHCSLGGEAVERVSDDLDFPE